MPTTDVAYSAEPKTIEKSNQFETLPGSKVSFSSRNIPIPFSLSKVACPPHLHKAGIQNYCGSDQLLPIPVVCPLLKWKSLVQYSVPVLPLCIERAWKRHFLFEFISYKNKRIHTGARRGVYYNGLENLGFELDALAKWDLWTDFFRKESNIFCTWEVEFVEYFLT